jgi:type VI secretion system protein ImpL
MKKIKYYFLKHQPYVMGVVFFLAMFLVWGQGVWLGFASLYSLLAGILVFLLASAVYVLFLYRGAAHHPDLEALLREDADQAVLNASPQDREEVALLRERLLQSIERLRSSQARKGRRSSDALYALPWYLVIGQPAAGKSTMLYHSGLNFPYADREGVRVAGLGGTRNCDWFFSSEAVLLDTAGRYMQSQEEADKWRAFLALLRRYRPRRPLNGLIVAVSVQDILAADAQERERLAKRLRERIQEVHDLLELRLPIYLVFTKCDLVPGFTDFYRRLDARTRGEVMGTTFAHEDFARSDWGQRFAQALDELLAHWQAVADRQLVDQDIQVTRRDASAYRFPLELAALGSVLRAFVEALLRANPYQSAELLRGVYFTSALDGAEASVSEHARRVSERFSLAAQPGAQAGTAQAQSLFINGLFQKVIVPDQHLVALYTGTRREGRRKAAWASTAAAVGLLLCSLWVWSYWNNRSQLQALSVELGEAVQQDAEAPGQYAQWHSLDALQRWAQQYYVAHRQEGVPLRLRLGLYQGREVEPLLRARYFSQLEAVMLKPTGENLTRSLYLLTGIEVYQRNARGLGPVTGVGSVEPRALPPDNRAESVANFGKATLETYLMLSRSHREKADPAFLKAHLPDYWYPDIAARLGTDHAAAQAAGGTSERQYQSAGRQIVFYSDQIREPDVPRIMDNAFLVSSSRNYIDSLLSQSLRSIETITLESDTLFAFGRADFQSLQAGGQRQLNAIAGKLLSTPDVGRILITGHADQLGDPQGNLRVSRQRAETIRTYLVGKGVPAEIIEATGEGSGKPLVQCEASLPRAQLIQCLEPNRRVEIEVRALN